jgi:tight adherence protein B
MIATAVITVGWFGVVAGATIARRATARNRLVSIGGSPALAAGGDTVPRPPRRFLPRRRHVADDLPEVLDELARSLRSGLSLRQALMAVPDRGALASATRRLRHELDLGRPISAAVSTWVDRLDDPLADLAGSALAVAIDVGGTGAVAIDRVAATVRDRRTIQREVVAQASQARASALVIGLLPAGFFVLATATDPASTRFLIGTGTGLACLMAGLVLDALAIWWMHHITADVRW